MIRVDAVWLAVQPLDMRLGTEAALARVVGVFGAARQALAALENSTALAPDRAEGWLLKATLLRRLERLPQAQSAIESAATLAPTNPEIALEAGVIAVLAGRDDAARKSWQSVLALAKSV